MNKDPASTEPKPFSSPNALLISFQWGRFYKTRNEAQKILKKMGDNYPRVEWTSVDGIAIAYTSLENREVIRKCRELWQRSEASFDFAVKWVPVDYWCTTDLDAMKQLIEDKAPALIGPEETWGMIVHKRRWQVYHTAEIVANLAPGVNRKVDLSYPDKIVWVDVLGPKTAISVLKPEDIFSVVLET